MSGGRVNLLLSFLLVALPLVAQTTRYHYGDDPRWPAPAFDNSAWPEAKDDRWPLLPLDSDGYVWVQYRRRLHSTSLSTDFYTPPLTFRDGRSECWWRWALLGRALVLGRGYPGEAGAGDRRRSRCGE